MGLTAMQDLTVGVVRLPHARDFPLPRYETIHSAGMDLLAAVGENEKITLQNGERARFGPDRAWR
jgi:dUTP pyrophosphatase